MRDKLSKKVLLEWLDNWRDFCGESCIKADCVMGIEECEPAYKQIVALIKKPEVTKVKDFQTGDIKYGRK